MQAWRMIRTALFSLAIFIALPAGVWAHPHIIAVNERIEVAPQQMLTDLRQAQVVFVGEFHDDIGHHQAQKAIIEALAEDGTPLFIGLEMFRQDSQEALDQWLAGRLSLSAFLDVYEDNWSMWPQYRSLFEFARRQGIPMVGLNIPREITGKVARSGFKSLPEKQRQMLGEVQCVVNPAYGSFIRQAMGGHGGHDAQFLFFCEAQLLWDTMMARRLIEFLAQNPGSRMVVLAGSGHAWKFGIPRQMLEQSDLSYRVILPEVFGRVDRRNVTHEIADYLWLDVGDDGWQF